MLSVTRKYSVYDRDFLVSCAIIIIIIIIINYNFNGF